MPRQKGSYFKQLKRQMKQLKLDLRTKRSQKDYLSSLIFIMRKQRANQFRVCANPNQACESFFETYPSLNMSIVRPFGRVQRHRFRQTSYFFVLFTCHIYLVQSGEVTIWEWNFFCTWFAGPHGHTLRCVNRYYTISYVRRTLS